MSIMHKHCDMMEYFDDAGGILFPSRLGLEPPAKLRKTNNVTPMNRASSAVILNFGNPEINNIHSTAHHHHHHYANHPVYFKPEVDEELGAATNKRVSSRVRPPQPQQPYDHITAERKRREHLSQLFVALSTIVPGLKKMDKTSVLGDAITYLKKLQEREKTLEEKTAKKTIESVTLVKKNHHEISIGEENHYEQPLPEIEAKICDKTILFNILCEKRKGLLVNLLSQVERLNLVVLNTSVASFGTEAFHVTITAEVEKDFNTAVKDVVAAIRSSLQVTAPLLIDN